jgi:hypothetical protein
MPACDATTILQAAYKAHRQGYAAAATALFREILHVHPGTPEAAAARFYIDNGCRLPPTEHLTGSIVISHA